MVENNKNNNERILDLFLKKEEETKGQGKKKLKTLKVKHEEEE